MAHKKVARRVSRSGYVYSTDLEMLNYKRWHHMGSIARCKKLLCSIAHEKHMHNLGDSIDALLTLMEHDVRTRYDIDKRRLQEARK